MPAYEVREPLINNSKEKRKKNMKKERKKESVESKTEFVENLESRLDEHLKKKIKLKTGATLTLSHPLHLCLFHLSSFSLSPVLQALNASPPPNEQRLRANSPLHVQCTLK